MTKPGEGVELPQAVCVEALITSLLVLVVFAVAGDPSNSPTVKGSGPLAIGLTVGACHLFAVPLTGSSMNPARSLGPAAVMGDFTSHWVYWVGPLLGGVAGALVYQIVFRAPQPKRRKILREDTSPPYQKPSQIIEEKDLALAQSNPAAFNVLVRQETSAGRELVWLEK